MAVAATDKDSGKYGQIMYSLVSGNDYGLFRLNRRTGEITVVRPLTKTSQIYRLSISATDGSGLTSDRNADVIVSVVDTKQKPAVFQQARYSFSVDEDVPVNFIVGTVSASGEHNFFHR